MADCGLPVPSLVTARLAFLAPDAVGANAMLTVHDADGFNVAGQLFAVMV